jgi:5-methyltetrahydrofolate--homocysteine methyltransferase
MSEQEEDIVLADLSDEDLVEQMFDDLYDGLADEVREGTEILLGRGWDPKRVLDDALVGGMNIVGEDFRDGILFVPEVLLAANSMKAGMAILRPLLAETGAKPIGKMVIGTVKGDIHDIGKNLVGMMMEGAGFEVIDLGINTDAAGPGATRYPRHVGTPDDDHAVHESRYRQHEGKRRSR